MVGLPVVAAALEAQSWQAVPVGLLWGIALPGGFRGREHSYACIDTIPPDTDAHCCTVYTSLLLHIL